MLEGRLEGALMRAAAGPGILPVYGRCNAQRDDAATYYGRLGRDRWWSHSLRPGRRHGA